MAIPPQMTVKQQVDQLLLTNEMFAEQLKTDFYSRAIRFAAQNLPQQFVPRHDMTAEEAVRQGISPYQILNPIFERPTIQGVVVSPDPQPDQEDRWITRDDSNEMGWLPSYLCTLGFRMLPIAWTVGVPICYTLKWHWPLGRHRPPNHAVSGLTINYDEFWIDMEIRRGKVVTVGDKDIKGSCFLFRHDARRLHMQDVETLLDFLNNIVRPMGFEDKFEISTLEDLGRRIDDIKHRLTPEMFDKHWMARRKRKLEEGDMSWDGLETPVTIGIAEAFTSTGRRRFGPHL